MSKIGKKPIEIPADVQIKFEGQKVSASGKMGSGEITIPIGLKLEMAENRLQLKKIAQDSQTRMSFGTFRQLIANLIKGVAEGWKKELEVRGTGFRSKLEGEKLVLNIGFSHPVHVDPPEGIKFEANENKISVIGIDKVLVGQVADKLRKIYPPDPYKGKGIRYFGEQISLKPGKTVKAGSGGATAGGK